MKPFEFDWQSGSRLTTQDIAQYQETLLPHIQRLKKVLGTQYTTPSGSINLPSDTNYHERITDLVQEKRKLNPAAIVLIGIGGSSLGTLALWQAWLPYQDGPSPELLCVETVDPDMLAPLLAHVNVLLSQEKKVIVAVISKSGTTTETVANFLLFEYLIKQHHPKHYHEYIVAITDRDSKLWQYALGERYSLLEVPQQVGGRYSVFSAVGLFPLGMLGINIKELLAAAQSAIEPSLDTTLENNPAALTAIFLAAYYKKGIAIADLFLFSPYLAKLGGWFAQLMGESIGKQKKAADGSLERVGITPTVSLGTNDLHSVGQLYVGGPRARCTTFITVKSYRWGIAIPDSAHAEKIASAVKGKSIDAIMHAIAKGVLQTYQKQQLPYLSITFADTNIATLGCYMQHSMIMMMYLANLLEVNAFDQPEVELYKEETRRILAHE